MTVQKQPISLVDTAVPSRQENQDADMLPNTTPRKQAFAAQRMTALTF